MSKHIVVRIEKATGNEVERVKTFRSLVSACAYCRKMNGHLSLESPLRVFYYAAVAA